MKQSAVEWYEIEINSLIEKYEAKEISEREFITMKHNLFYKAKEIEKQQQCYSEEDMKECWMACLGFNKPEKFNSRVKFEKWFEQFKNK